MWTNIVWGNRQRKNTDLEIEVLEEKEARRECVIFKGTFLFKVLTLSNFFQ